MKLIKITSLGCPSCIIMNNRLEEIINNYNYQIESYDYDFDNVEKYNPGNILPVLIIESENEKEIRRLIGEKNIEELKQFLEWCIWKK